MKRSVRGALSAVMLVAAVSCWDSHTHGSRAQGSVVYEPPAQAVHQPLFEQLKVERWLERMQTVLQVIRLPRPITLKTESCGEVDAYFERRTVGICYEYLQVVVRRIENGRLPDWVSPREALVGAFVDVVFHEFAHALIDQHALPVLGREEEAADQLSAYLMLQLGGGQAAGLIRGTAHVYVSWISYFQGRPAQLLASGASRREAREHPTAGQRLYNLVCIALGADRRRFDDLADFVDMPKERTDNCRAEYAQLARAYRVLVAPHIVKSAEEAARRELRSFLTE